MTALGPEGTRRVRGEVARRENARRRGIVCAVVTGALFVGLMRWPDRVWWPLLFVGALLVVVGVLVSWHLLATARGHRPRRKTYAEEEVDPW